MSAASCSTIARETTPTPEKSSFPVSAIHAMSEMPSTYLRKKRTTRRTRWAGGPPSPGSTSVVSRFFKAISRQGSGLDDRASQLRGDVLLRGRIQKGVHRQAHDTACRRLRLRKAAFAQPEARKRGLQV